jgi:hypothetical protein
MTPRRALTRRLRIHRFVVTRRRARSSGRGRRAESVEGPRASILDRATRRARAERAAGARASDMARDASRADGGVGTTRGDATRGGALRRTEMRRSGRDALSIDRFIKARKSTYDKRERIKRSRAEGAARRAKYERLRRKLTGRYERDEAFDPEAYERRLALIDNPELAREGTSGREERGGEEESEEEEEEEAAARGRVREDDDETPEERVTVKGKKKKFDPVKKAWEKARVAREEREAQKKAFLEEKARRAAALDARRRTRRDKTNLMRKKTKRGQPVMKHRVQSILDKLTADASS